MLEVLEKCNLTRTASRIQPFSGGFIIDTPGIKGFGLVTIEKATLNHYFPEMFRLLDVCKFNNCVHVGEPNCAVKNAVEKGEVSEERYVNYLEMYETFEEGPYR